MGILTHRTPVSPCACPTRSGGDPTAGKVHLPVCRHRKRQKKSAPATSVSGIFSPPQNTSCSTCYIVQVHYLQQTPDQQQEPWRSLSPKAKEASKIQWASASAALRQQAGWKGSPSILNLKGNSISGYCLSSCYFVQPGKATEIEKLGSLCISLWKR